MLGNALRPVPAIPTFSRVSGTELLQLNSSHNISALLALSVDNTSLLLIAYSNGDRHFLNKVIGLLFFFHNN